MFFTILNYIILIPVYCITLFVLYHVIQNNIHRKSFHDLCLDFFDDYLDLSKVRKRVFRLTFKLWLYLFICIVVLMFINVCLSTGVFILDSTSLGGVGDGVILPLLFFLFDVSLNIQAYKNPFFIFFCIFVISCIILAIFSFIKLLPTKSEKKALLEHWEKWKTLYSNSEYREIKVKFRSSLKGKETDKLKTSQLDIKVFFYNKDVSELKCAIYFLNYLEKNWYFINKFNLHNSIYLLDEDDENLVLINGEDDENRVLINGEECRDPNKIIEALIGNYFYLYFNNRKK
ncbi:membrane protein [Mycoplasma sp. HU2014]|nr:membrane protein [Mycoplasma sp. HU2014]